MKRKHFITTVLLAIPSLSFANLLNFDRNNLSFGKSNKKGLIVRAGESRFGGEIPTPKDAFLHCKVSTTDTQEGLFIQTSTPKIFKELEDRRRTFTNMKTKPFTWFRVNLWCI